ncbi:MAG: hypothetical protein AMS23_04335 [Bacteroides sp. SM1_62]|nr:MAG: hypothetical protein AMS23_04335 [Bacteroides sp. SM1_62]
MKKMLFLLLISTIAFSGCKFIGGKSVKSERDSLRAYAYTLEQKMAAQEQEHQASLDQLKRESQVMIDSIISIYENKAAPGAGNFGSAASGNYYVIVGAFKTPAYASNWSSRVADMGYQTEIVKVSYWNLVSAGSSTNLRSALNELSAIRSDVTSNAWVLVSR